MFWRSSEYAPTKPVSKNNPTQEHSNCADISRGVFITQSNIDDGDFFAEIVNGSFKLDLHKN